LGCFDLRRTGRPSAIDDLNHAEKTYGSIERIFSAPSRAKSVGEIVAHCVAKLNPLFERSGQQ